MQRHECLTRSYALVITPGFANYESAKFLLTYIDNHKGCILMKITRHFLIYCARYTSYAKINPNHCNDEKLQLIQSFKDRVVKVIAVLLLYTSVSKLQITNVFLFLCPRPGNSIVFLCLDVRNFFVEVFCEKMCLFLCANWLPHGDLWVTVSLGLQLYLKVASSEVFSYKKFQSKFSVDICKCVFRTLSSIEDGAFY